MRRARTLRPSFRSPRPLTAAQPLERRVLLATFTVTTVADSGPGSLREAIEMANLSTTVDEVRFNIPGNDLYRTITPQSPLPEIIAPLVIDGRTQPGYFNSPVVELNGTFAGAGANGLSLSAPQSAVRGLAINRFDGHGVALNGPRPASSTSPPVQGATAARVEACYIGTDVTGNVALPNGGAGVRVSASSTFIGSATIASPLVPPTPGRNVISGNGFAGVWIAQGTQPGPGISGTTIVNNYIGTNAGGNRALGNGREGILVETGGQLQIGSPTVPSPTQPAIRNVISGNAASGIRLATPSAGGVVTIQGNYIGTDATGSNALGNGLSPALPYRDGITVAMVGSVRVGLAQQGVRNVVSGNAGAGVAIHSGTDVQVTGNFIGTDATGNADLGNAGNGVSMTGASSIGRVTGNVISGNGGDGVHAARSNRAVTVGGNYIGTNATGTSALGNDGDGVELSDVAMTATIGGTGGPTPLPGTTPPPVLNPSATGRNVISANAGSGIRISAESSQARPHSVVGNYVGTDYAGTVPIGNGGSGIHLAATGVIVGGSASSQGNLISANGVNGITIVGPADLSSIPTQSGNQIVGNRVGVATAPRPGVPADADAVMGNRHHGVAIYYSSNNRIGAPSGTPSTTGNVIAYNGGIGVLVQGTAPFTPNSPAAATGNAITGNSIYNNGKLGIDLALAGEGVTPNDLRDADIGPNRLQNHPVITEAIHVPGSNSVSGRFMLNAEPSKTYRVEVFASVAPDPTGRGEGQAFVTAVTVTTDAGGTASAAFGGTYSLPSGGRTTPPAVPFLSATATEGTLNTSEFSPAVRAVPPQPNATPVPQGSAQVVGRHTFYNNSAFDGAGGDDAAIATDKRALLPGQPASFANVTSYSRGLNGVMVDIAGLPASATLTPDEFVARASDSSGVFHTTYQPYAVNVRRGAGVNGSDRVSLYWSDNLPTVDGVAPAVRNGWLEVKVLASAVTGLAVSDVFYFGNLPGETGHPIAGAGALRVDAFDFARTRSAASPDAFVTSRFDHNRDGVVDMADAGVVRGNFARQLAPLSAPPAVSVAAMPQRSAYRPGESDRIADELLA